MRTERVEFFSGVGANTARVRGLWRTPDEPGERLAAIVQGPGWLGLAGARDYERYHTGFTDAGFGVLAIDYRGFGESEGERGLVSPANQLDDLIAAVTYLTTRDDVDAEAIGAYATGGTGGGNVVLLAEADPRIRAVVSQYPVADGRDWLHRMRTEHEWITYLRDLAADRKERVRTGKSRLVHPREEIMVQTPERRQSTFKSDVDSQIRMAVPFAVVDGLLRYRPVDAAARLRTPLLVVAVEDDTTTPTDHATAIYEAALGPKKLVLQRNTSHYASYTQYAEQVIPELVAWYRDHLRARGDIEILTEGTP